ncbi:hypothetical protein ACFLV0_07090 [Chloroflexota bacterium]
MNWFDKHLNLTLVLALIGVCIITLGSSIIGQYIDGYVEGSPLSKTFWDYTEEARLAAVSGGICSIVLSSAVALWIIQQKGRSRWNFIWFLLPMGFVVILALKNHRESKPKNEGG